MRSGQPGSACQLRLKARITHEMATAEPTAIGAAVKLSTRPGNAQSKKPVPQKRPNTMASAATLPGCRRRSRAGGRGRLRRMMK